jgi:oligosaccharyltransferase complex subunit alpha (ribophorin I)
MQVTVLVCMILCVVSAITADDSFNSDIVNSKVQRTVDLTTHLARIVSRITLENGGKTAVRSYLVAIDPELSKSVSFVGATVRIGLQIVILVEVFVLPLDVYDSQRQL